MYSQTKPSFDKLYALAERQQGFFTARQAQNAGYSRQLHSYYTSTGEWIRKDRGIFRLKYFPVFPPFPESFYILYLWALNREGEPEGVFGYGTALYLHGLSTYVPPVIDMIVPKHFKRNSQPKGTTWFYKRTMDSSRTQELKGIRLTTPFWTIIDLLDTRRIDYDYILEALKDALAGMIIRPKQLKEADLNEAQRERLVAALERIGYEQVNEIRR
jgi:hypothetical protein